MIFPLRWNHKGNAAEQSAKITVGQLVSVSGINQPRYLFSSFTHQLNMKRINYIFLVLFALLTLPVFAQDAEVAVPATETPAATEDEEEEEDKAFSISGYVDAYGQKVFNDADGTSTPLAFQTSFAQENEGFGIGNVNLLLEHTVGKIGFVGQVGFGPRATAANGDAFPNVQQLFVTYAPTDAITLTLGNFGTFVGYEVIDAPANVNYTTSYMFSNGPFYHTGLKADVAISESFGAMVGIFNDTDDKFNSEDGFHYGAQLSASAGGFSAYLNFLGGTVDNEVLPDEDRNEFQVDLTAGYDVSETLYFGLNATSKSVSFNDEAEGGFTGIALYSTIGISEASAVGIRAELFTEVAPDALTVDNRSVFSLTASGNITINESLRIIPELRFDSSSDFATTYTDGAINFGSENVEDDSVASFILAAVYSF